MKEVVTTFHDYNVIPHDNVVVVEAMTTFPDSTGAPCQSVLRAMIKRKEADCESPCFNIYLPPQNYLCEESKKLYKKFQTGEVFVAVKCENLKIFRYKKAPTDRWCYFGTANSYQVMNNKKETEK